jgi:hypothetical protein
LPRPSAPPCGTDRLTTIAWRSSRSVVPKGLLSVGIIGGGCAGINRHGEGDEKLYIEGIASQDGPESCAFAREGIAMNENEAGLTLMRLDNDAAEAAAKVVGERQRRRRETPARKRGKGKNASPSRRDTF